ncbi:MAG: M15 family metallopeptidase [Beijerinckiaceae bacterium]|nr:M15 family metallopeptidase [Beijerinckiaceae bacterium]
MPGNNARNSNVIKSAWAMALLVMAAGLTCKPAAAAEVSLAERLELFRQAWPGLVAAVDGNRMVLTDGQSIMIDDGLKKDHQQKLKDADVEDMLSQVYPMDGCFKGSMPVNSDPGRIRNLQVMKAIFGATKQQVVKRSVLINWYGQKLAFTTTAGADKALQAVRDDLEKLPPKFSKFYRKSGGTFVWRTVASTQRLSQHSFASAIDINTAYTNYWLWSGGKPGKVPIYKNRIPMEIVRIFERHGFIWGGKWYHYDTMHFSYRPDLIAIGTLAAKRGCVR